MNRQSFINLVEDNQESLRSFLIALCCGDTNLADDLAQESFLRAYIVIDSLDNISNFSSWIRRVAYNCFISYHRSRKPVEREDAAAAIVADNRADDSFRYEHLYKALSNLNEKERTAVVLYYLEEYPTPEIAQTMETSENNVRQLLSRGRNHLRNYLSQ